MLTATSASADLQKWEAALISKSMSDPAFKKEFLANPKSVAERELGVSIPATINLQAVEAPANTLMVVLPYMPSTGADGEMSDADLESVAGGSKSGANAFFNTVGNGIVNGVNLAVDNANAVGSFAAGVAGAGKYDNGSCKAG